MEDIIANITEVLLKTSAFNEDPLGGKAATLFYDTMLRGMQKDNFHPGKALNLIAGMGPGLEDLAPIRRAKELPRLSDAQWERLIPVGQMQAAPIHFARGTARMNIQGQRDLSALAKRLEAWPQYYLLVRGHSRAEGDPEANRRLALERAQAAAAHLASEGLSENRIRAQAAPPSRDRATGGAAQSVSFVVGQRPF